MSAKGKFWQAVTKTACAIALAGLLSAAMPAAEAANKAGNQLSAQQRAQVSRILSYLNRISTMQARFIQTNPDGTVWQGTVSIKRPGNFRFEYDPPVPHTLISNGTWFIHVDRELHESNFLPLDRTPARFLLAKRIDFQGDMKLIGYFHEAGLIHLKIMNRDHPDLGYVTMTFDERPLRLRHWRVTDGENKRTLVTLQNTRFGMQLRPKLFEYVEPEEENLYQ